MEKKRQGQVGSVSSGLLTISQLAEHLQLSVGTIYYWVHRREIPFMKVGKHLRFDLGVVLRHFEAMTPLPAPCATLRDTIEKEGQRSLTTRSSRPAEFRREE